MYPLFDLSLMRSTFVWIKGERENSKLEHSCQSFVPDCIWFSDSADWMWPCDPWLPGRERWGHGCWGFGRGEPTPEDYPRSAWYASFMCARVFVCICVNRVAAGSCWLTRREWGVRNACHDIMTFSAASLNTIFTPGTIWHLLLTNLFGKTSDLTPL